MVFSTFWDEPSECCQCLGTASSGCILVLQQTSKLWEGITRKGLRFHILLSVASPIFPTINYVHFPCWKLCQNFKCNVELWASDPSVSQFLERKQKPKGGQILSKKHTQRKGNVQQKYFWKYISLQKCSHNISKTLENSPSRQRKMYAHLDRACWY